MNVQNYYTAIVFGIGLLGFCQLTSSIEGTLLDVRTGEPIVFATVILYKNDRAVTAVASDLEGSYTFKELSSGVYELEVSHNGFQALRRKNIYISEGESKGVDLQLSRSLNPVDTLNENVTEIKKDKGKWLDRLGLIIDKVLDKKVTEK